MKNVYLGGEVRATNGPILVFNVIFPLEVELFNHHEFIFGGENFSHNLECKDLLTFSFVFRFKILYKWAIMIGPDPSQSPQFPTLETCFEFPQKRF